MARTKISEFSATPGNNTDIDSINIAEGCAPSGINDAIRELMAQLKDFQTGAVGDSFNGPVGTTTAAAGAFTTLAASDAVTLSGGTANGVPYLNGSKVLTSGSALVFDGTNLGIGTSSPAQKLEVSTTSGSYQMRLGDGAVSAVYTYDIGRSSVDGYFRFYGNQTGANGYIFGGINGERARIDFSGNLGLGVTPSAWDSTFKAFESGAGSLNGGSFFVQNNGDYTASIATNLYFNAGWKYKNSAPAARYEVYQNKHQWFTAPSGTAGNAITFNQVMTLSPAGSFAALGLGCTPGAIGGDLDVIGNQNGISVGYTTSIYRRMVIAATNVMNFSSASNTATLSAAGAWTNASDARLKKNIVEIKYGLKTVMATQPRSYERNDVDGNFIGFVAQELQSQIPEVVFGSEDEQYTVDYGSLVAVAFKAIQEQQAIIATLQSDVAALKAAA